MTEIKRVSDPAWDAMVWDETVRRVRHYPKDAWQRMSPDVRGWYRGHTTASMEDVRAVERELTRQKASGLPFTEEPELSDEELARIMEGK